MKKWILKYIETKKSKVKKKKRKKEKTTTQKCKLEKNTSYSYIVKTYFFPNDIWKKGGDQI